MKRWAVPLLLCAAVVGTYGNTLANGFVWDDHFVALSPANRSWSNAGAVLSSPDVLSSGQPTNYYRPLSRLLFLVDYQLFGLDAPGYHLMNVVAHLAVVLLTFAVGRKLLKRDGPAAIAALLVAVHPIHSEPVNLVTARNNMLAAAGVLASLLAYLRGRDEGRRGAYAGSAVAFFAGLLCKETALMLLPVLVVMEATSGRRWRDVLARQGPVLGAMVVLAGVYLGLRGWVLHDAVGQRITAGDLSRAAVNVLHSVPKYLGLVAWPARLTLGYEEPVRYVTSWWVLAGAWTAIGVAVALLVRQRRPVTRLGLQWAALNFIPVSTIVPFPSAAMAERYLYLPVIGLWLVVADQVARLELAGRRRTLAAVVAGAILACLAAVTFERNQDWRDDRTLFTAAIRAEPRSAFAHANLGVVLRDEGDLAGAEREWNEALQLDPRHVGALAELGRLRAERGDLQTAERYLRQVLALDGGDPEAHFNLARVLERTGRPEEAADHYERFLAHAGDHAEVVGQVRARLERLRGSVRPNAR